METSAIYNFNFISGVISMQAKSYESVFYCAYQIDECLEEPSPIADREVQKLLPVIAERKKNFIGFIDEYGVVLQFYIDDIDKIWVEIPYPKEKGSYGTHLDTDRFFSVAGKLEAPFMRYKNELGLKFRAW